MFIPFEDFFQTEMLKFFRCVLLLSTCASALFFQSSVMLKKLHLNEKRSEAVNRPIKKHLKFRNVISQQHLRLINIGYPWKGILQVSEQGYWREVCADNWQSSEAIVACNNLGYDRLESFEVKRNVYAYFSSFEFRCRGTEGDLMTCKTNSQLQNCSSAKIIQLTCKPNYVSACKPEEVNFAGKCFKFVTDRLSHHEADKACTRMNSTLLEITSVNENSFLSNYLLDMYNDEKWHVGATYSNSVLTWNSSGAIMQTADSKGRPDKRWIVPSNGIAGCAVLYNRFSYLSSDYFLLSSTSCNDKLPFICTSRSKNIGCITGQGHSYAGSASVTRFGHKCRPWNMWQSKEQLIYMPDSNEPFCQNPDKDKLPWCFTGETTFDYCDIPECFSGEPMRMRSACSAGSFLCDSGDCYTFSQACNGINDCSTGEDEQQCKSSLQLYKKFDHLRLKTSIAKKLSGLSAEMCARHCLKDETVNCISFSYIFENSNSICLFYEHDTSSHILTLRENSTFYELEDKDSRFGFKVRLNSKSNTTGEGIVQVRVNGEWGNICDDMWDLIDATVVCRQLGFSLGAIGAYGGFKSPDNGAKIFMDDIQCKGDEDSLQKCKFDGFGKHDCYDNELAAVKCKIHNNECSHSHFKCQSGSCIPINFLCDSYKDCDDGSDELPDRCQDKLQVRLFGTRDRTSGRVEISRYGIWGTICNDDFDVKDAIVLCRMLGYNGTSRVDRNSTLPPGIGPIWVDELNCAGSEENIEECSMNPWGQNDCIHDEDVAIECSQSTQPTDPSPEGTFISNDRCGVRVIEPLAHYSSLYEYSEQESLKLTNPQHSDTKHSSSNSSFFSMDNVARIVGGISVNSGSYPWQADIRLRTKSRSMHWCGGSIISEFYILTAAHCVKNYPINAYVIRVGENHQEVAEENEVEFDVQRIIFHDRFNEGTKLNNDIALIRIKSTTGIKFNTYVQPICLPPSDMNYTAGTKCEISGWGSTNVWKSSPTLQSAFLPILPIETCRRDDIYGSTRITDSMFCAGYLEGGIDSCKGDSGGPFACQYENSFSLLGIISWGQGCAKKNRPGVYVKVSEFVEWIQNNIIS